MHRQKRDALYNILLPLWLLVWFPSPLWLLLIPANYLVDRIVLRWSLRGMDGRDDFCQMHTWKVCLAGFASDFVGSLILLAAYLVIGMGDSGLAHDIVFGLGFNPFSHSMAFFITLVATVVSGFCIYALDLRILKAADLGAEQARRSATRLALITAPYLFLFPSALLYQ